MGIEPTHRVGELSFPGFEEVGDHFFPAWNVRIVGSAHALAQITRFQPKGGRPTPVSPRVALSREGARHGSLQHPRRLRCSPGADQFRFAEISEPALASASSSVRCSITKPEELARQIIDASWPRPVGSSKTETR